MRRGQYHLAAYGNLVVTRYSLLISFPYWSMEQSLCTPSIQFTPSLFFLQLLLQALFFLLHDAVP